MIKTAEAMVKCLEQEGIKVVFGYPGAAICPFYDYLSRSSIRHILVRQEQNGGHSANGYARMTNKPAVCIATSGPGATNLITAIATAYADSVPLVVITGQVCVDQIGRDVFQEADITGSAEPFVKHSYLVKDAEQLPEIFKEAFYLAGTGRKGPVLIDVPMDIQQQEISDFEYPESVDIRAYKPTTKGNSLQIKKVAKALNEAEKPLICAGGGVFSSDAQSELYALAEKAKIPVVSTMMGIGALRGEDSLYFGMIGTHGRKLANKAVQDCDLILMIGARVGDRAVKTPFSLAETTTIVHIDIDPAEIGKNIPTDIPLVGDAKYILTHLIEQVDGKDHSEWLNSLSAQRVKKVYEPAQKGFINPKEFMARLSAKAPENTVLVADVGQNQIWCCNNFNVKGGRFLTSGGMGTMGYSLPCGIGAKLASPESLVISVCGDGAFQMSMMELATLVQHNVPVKIILMTNTRLGMVRELQTKNYADNQVAVHLDGNPDFIKLADAYGIATYRLDSPENEDMVIDRLINDKEAFFVECIVSPDESTL